VSLLTGARIGPYEIVVLLGAGGMGEVYRTPDTRPAATWVIVHRRLMMHTVRLFEG